MTEIAAAVADTAVSLCFNDIWRGASDSPPLRLRAEAWWKKDCIRRENVKNKPTVVTKGSKGQEDTQSFDDWGGGGNVREEDGERRDGGRFWSLDASSLALTQFFQLSRHGLGAEGQGGTRGSLGRRGSCGEKAWC